MLAGYIQASTRAQKLAKAAQRFGQPRRSHSVKQGVAVRRWLASKKFCQLCDPFLFS